MWRGNGLGLVCEMLRWITLLFGVGCCTTSAAGAEATVAARGTDQPAVFVRGINLNGPALVIDGYSWEAGTTPNLRCNGNAFENQAVLLKPSTDDARTKMIRSSRWGREIDVDLLNLPSGEYQIFLYVWEDNDSTTFSISVNNRQVVNRYASRDGGVWKRFGPWLAHPINGVIRLSARGGDANLSGVEIWRGTGRVPDPTNPDFAQDLTNEQRNFFESKIRPLLIAKCYSCHSQDAKELGGNLLLDSRAGIVQGGDTEPPIIPGNPDASLLIRAVRQTDPELKMPPESRLAHHEIADLEAWVRMRAPDPRKEDTVAKTRAKHAIDWEQARDFWSLKPLQRPKLPTVKNPHWPKNGIDYFILEKLQKSDLEPAQAASKAVWLRRVTFALTGLPPTPEELAAFESDHAANANAKVVERLLESPRYGERWGRHWLDVVRYADTAGDNSDFPVPQMFLYRDWVIDALNRDLPYDQFVREQLAGDLIGGATLQEKQQRLIATGYIANARRFGSRVDDYPWHLTIEDTLDNLGRAFLATTINCARCHHHKFDPVTTEDYYGLYGIFQSTRYPWPGIELEQRQRDLVSLLSPEETKQRDEVWQKRGNELRSQLRELEKQRDAAKGEQKKTLDILVKEARGRADQHEQQGVPVPMAYAVQDAAKIGDAAVQIKGDPAKTGAVVPRRFLTVLHGEELPQNHRDSGRLQLANWIVDPRNPLTARVIVNRIWLYHFGKGIVPTPNDFGRQGKPPTHPELLDYLASELLASGWSIKALQRQIVLSRTYQMSSQRTARAVAQDPTNEWLSGFPRRRLDAEALRDKLLQLSGRLQLERGGPHPFPPRTEWKFTQHNPFKAIYETRHRSVYLMTQRIQRHPYLAIFDGPDPAASTPARLTSTTPLQALFLMNDEFVHEQAEGITRRLLSKPDTEQKRVEYAYRLLFCRGADSVEVDSALEFLADARQVLATSGTTTEFRDALAWQALTRTWLRLNEFVYLD